MHCRLRVNSPLHVGEWLDGPDDTAELWWRRLGRVKWVVIRVNVPGASKVSADRSRRKLCTEWPQDTY